MVHTICSDACLNPFALRKQGLAQVNTQAPGEMLGIWSPISPLDIGNKISRTVPPARAVGIKQEKQLELSCSGTWFSKKAQEITNSANKYG